MSPPPDDTAPVLLRSARAILRPLVRQLIAHGITYPAFSRLVKEVYIEVGTRHFTLPFKRQTDSRVALVTGITRKEIGQIRRGQAPHRREAIHPGNTLAARVVWRWLAGSPYAAPDGTPYLLPYEARRGAPSFAALVETIGGDIPARAVLDELLRVGAAKLTPGGEVFLTAHAYVPAAALDEKLAMLGSDAAELIEAIVHNLERPGVDAFLQRTVRYDNLGADGLPALRARARELGEAFTERVNELLAAADRDRNPAAPGGARSRAVIGVYYCDAPVDVPSPESEDA
jgi:hypothetical protein